MSEYLILEERKKQVLFGDSKDSEIVCGKCSIAGSVSQRACAFSGARVVLYPIADALHVVHGPIGCAAYTWDIRGALSSGPQLHRNSFSTALQEKDIVFGGEKKLEIALIQLIEKYNPKAVFVYLTCIVGVIGDDVEGVARKVKKRSGIDVIVVHSEGFKGAKKDGYEAACDSLIQLIGTKDIESKPKFGINIIGDFNLAGELWILEDYYKSIGVDIVAKMTGDSRVNEIRQAHNASLNVVQCSGSMIKLAKMMEEKYGIPYIRVSYFGIEDMSDAIYDVVNFFGDNSLRERAKELVKSELGILLQDLEFYKEKLRGKKAAIYVGGAFKAISLIKALKLLEIDVVLAGSQNGTKEEYNIMRKLLESDAVIVDDSNPLELVEFVKNRDVDLFIGGVKERPIAHKLGIGFVDHNHERKQALAGYQGMLNFADEIYKTTTSPIWKFLKDGNFRRS